MSYDDPKGHCPPRWTTWLLRGVAPAGRHDEVLGDLDEAHRLHLGRHGRWTAGVLTGLEALDVALALLRDRWRSRRTKARSGLDGRPGGARGRRGRPLVPRGPSWFSWLDVKLGLRMAAKYPALSLVSVVGIGVAAAIAAGSFGVVRALTSSPLPLEDGDRVVTIQNTDVTGLDQARSTHLHDLEVWRDEAGGVLEDFGAYRIIERNLLTEDGSTAPARIAEISASAFRLARVPPLLGRPLVADDEREGAAPVAVIGHGVWQDRFGGSPDVVGSTIRIGATRHEIVGVMPRGFAFPINNRIWTPLRLDPGAFERGRAPPLDVFARLAPDVTMEEARALLEALGQRHAARYPETHEHLRTRVFPYTQELVWGPITWILYVGQMLVNVLLIVIAVNVAALIYARTTTRAGEIAVRTALGASRRRIAMQLFAEALVLSTAGTAAGLGAAGWLLERVERIVVDVGGEQVPFWWDFGLSADTVTYAFVLAVAAAAIVGVLPALGATGRRLQASLQSAGAGAAPLRLGRAWTMLIVAQIALAVAVLPVALHGSTLLASGRSGVPSPLSELVVAQLVLDAETEERGGGGDPDPRSGADENPMPGADGDPLGLGARYATLRPDVVRRLEADPRVTHVAPAAPAPWEDPDLRFEMEGGSAPAEGTTAMAHSAATGHRVGRSRVDPAFFAALDMAPVSGRLLGPADADPGAAAVVVNRTFVDLILGGGDPLGRRVRFPDPLRPGDPEAVGPWLPIVGVVSEPPRQGIARPEARVYEALPAEAAPVALVVRVAGDEPAAFLRPMRELVASIDPMLRLLDLTTLEERQGRSLAIGKLTVVGLIAVALAVLLLAVAGLYALVSFTVGRRHREIAIRSALGAQPHRVLGGVLSRAAWQIALGIAIGVLVSGALDRALGQELLGGRAPLMLPAVAALMAAVALVASWGPARRGLSVQPTEALKAD